MEFRNPKYVRGRILQILYEHFFDDPMKMLTPEDLLSDDTIPRQDLGASAHYLHERGLIELLIGYNPPLFSVARISPDGVDLVEDKEEFRRRFEGGSETQEANFEQAAVLVMSLAEEAGHAPLKGLHREWLFRDVTRLRDELRRPPDSCRRDVIVETIEWIRGYFNGRCDEHMKSLRELERLLGLDGQGGTGDSG